MRATGRLRRGGVLAAALIVCGCAGELTYERFETVEVGTATRADVEAALGPPWQTVDDTWVYHDPERGISAWIHFEQDLVADKKWADPQRLLVGRTDHASADSQPAP